MTIAALSNVLGLTLYELTVVEGVVWSTAAVIVRCKLLTCFARVQMQHSYILMWANGTPPANNSRAVHVGWQWLLYTYTAIQWKSTITL